MGDIENLTRHRGFQIKFCAFKKKGIENRISRSRDIGNLSCRNVEKTTFFDNFFFVIFLKKNRGITLISCLAKFFTIILNNRLKVVEKWVISQIQVGFHPGYSTLGVVLTIMCTLILYKKIRS